MFSFSQKTSLFFCQTFGRPLDFSTQEACTNCVEMEKSSLMKTFVTEKLSFLWSYSCLHAVLKWKLNPLMPKRYFVALFYSV